MRVTGVFVALAFTAMLAACATPGPDYATTDVATGLTPREAVSGFSQRQGQTVLWGGVIIAGRNLEDYTRIEVLAYPLDNDQRPMTDRQPLGRFLVRTPGYLETADYQAGRLLTIKGAVTEIAEGRIGEAAYTYPVVGTEQLHLWPVPAAAQPSGPQVRFGVGVIFSR